MPGSLALIDHVVVLMLENRSFDHMLGFLYTDAGNVSASGQAYEGLTGTESNPDGKGGSVAVFRIGAQTPNAYLMPGVDPGEGFLATNAQLFGSTSAPASPPAVSNRGFVADFASTLALATKKHPDEIVPGTQASDIMGCYGPEMLPILSGLARGYAVCDQWFASAPTETLPNRAFACAGTSQGHLDDSTHSFTVPSIFGALGKAGVSWQVFGYSAPPLTRGDFPDTLAADDSHFGLFTDFQAAAAAGTLASYTFLEPAWSGAGQNDQHPVSDVAAGEQLIHDVYYALHKGPAWPATLLIVTYDEHGGCFDHVAPPWSATPPDPSAGEFGFDFRRFGVRVPTVLVSPLIEAGTVFRVGAGATPLDHTAILRTLEMRFGIAPLTARDAAASDLSAALTLTTPRTDDPLLGVAVPVSGTVKPAADKPTHLQMVQAQMAARLPMPDASVGVHEDLPNQATASEMEAYIVDRDRRWRAGRAPGK
jgi:phospholipase C